MVDRLSISRPRHSHRNGLTMDNFTKSWLGTSAFIAERDRTARVQTARLTRAGETPEPWMLEKADAILSTAAMVSTIARPSGIFARPGPVGLIRPRGRPGAPDAARRPDRGRRAALASGAATGPLRPRRGGAPVCIDGSI